MIKMGEKKSSLLGKRFLDINNDQDDDGVSPAKRNLSFMKRLQDVSQERQEANSSNSA